MLFLRSDRGFVALGEAGNDSKDESSQSCDLCQLHPLQHTCWGAYTHFITHWDLSIAKSTVIILLSKYHLSFVFLPSRWRRIQTHLKPPLPPPQGPHTRQSPSYKVTAVWMAGRGRGNVKRWVPAAVSYEFNVCVYHEGTGEITKAV